jgi:hypothetical protein
MFKMYTYTACNTRSFISISKYQKCNRKNRQQATASWEQDTGFNKTLLETGRQT